VEQGWAQITTPCENQGWLLLDSGSRRGKQRVLLDPGHGGNEAGAVGPSGLVEKELNLDIARRTAALLEAEEIETALTRTEDYRATIVFRAELAKAVHPDAVLSIHHNAEPDTTFDRPGSETFYQHDSPSSKRLAGLVYEETVAALSRFPASWAGNRDAGAKWRLNSRGADYYGILRHTFASSITSVLSEAAFITNPSEEELLRREDVRAAEAQGLSKAILRFLRTDDPGSGFTTPYPRGSPAGPGGGRAGCIDPA
jgi:N-acetylmuramoyl-L-alanine amidase